MSDSALKSLEATMRKLETAMKSHQAKWQNLRVKPCYFQEKPPTPGKSLKLTAKEKKNFHKELIRFY